MKTKILILISCTLALHAQAGSATWNLNPTSADWNTAANWTPATVPNSASDSANFATSNTTAVVLSANTIVAAVNFIGGASAFTIINPGLSLTLDGSGVANLSSVTQNVVCNPMDVAHGGLISFTSSANAGSSSGSPVVYTVNGVPGGHSSSISFFDTSNASAGTFIANGSTLFGVAGFVDFFGSSSAALGTFTSNGSTSGAGIGGGVVFHEQSIGGAAHFTTFGGVASGGGGGGGGSVGFTDTANAANCVITNNATLPGGSTAGFASFSGSANAGHAVITNKGGGGANGTFGALTQFGGSATAGNAVITNEGSGSDGTGGGSTTFIFGGNGGDATFTNEGGATRMAGGGFTEFSQGSNAGNATLIANGASVSGFDNGGTVVFSYDSDGGTARVIVSGNGTLSLIPHDATPVTVGSVEGSGKISLGGHDLIVGSNNLTTTYQGRISDAVGGGTVTKVGRGTWNLGGTGAYSGGTTVSGGTLEVNNVGASATGSGPVAVTKGTLSGRGLIAGAVTVGTGRGRTSGISPGTFAARNIGSLTIQRALTFRSDGSYTWQVDSTAVTVDTITAAGVTIGSGATFTASDLGSGLLPVGMGYVVLSNTAATPISGTFANLPDGATITVGSNHLQASYSGGDGNDLELTVVL